VSQSDVLIARSRRRISMKDKMRRFVVILVAGVALMTSIRVAFADSENKDFAESESLKQLSAEWWQWALSIPTSENPLLDATGGKGVIGQRGSVWFLAGVFEGGTATRTCFVPEGKVLFFPVINAINFNTPNVCGQGAGNLLVSDMRALSAAVVDGAANLSVAVDGIAIKNLRRVKSEVFEVALPEENVFDSLCGGPGTLPADTYSPAVDDGIYARLNPLDIGHHTLHFHSESQSSAGTFVQDVTYNLKIVPVLDSER
jgi:hypothetical protein